jgi:hypothetical protein
VADLKVSIEGEGKSFELVTDSQGRFRLENIPDGMYKARPLLPNRQYKIYYWVFEEFTLNSKTPSVYPDRTAVTINFHVGWNNHLSGKILDSEGNPIRDADEHVGFSLQAFVGAEYWIYGESSSSGRGEPIKIQVEQTNEPLRIVIPFPKPAKPSYFSRVATEATPTVVVDQATSWKVLD